MGRKIRKFKVMNEFLIEKVLKIKKEGFKTKSEKREYYFLKKKKKKRECHCCSSFKKEEW